jgi:hypothetical protein
MVIRETTKRWKNMAAALDAQLSQQTNRNKFVDVGVEKQT